MNAIQNVNTYMQSNKKLNNLEIIQKQIQDELDMIPERESKHFDPFKPVEPVKEKKIKK